MQEHRGEYQPLSDEERQKSLQVAPQIRDIVERDSKDKDEFKWRDPDDDQITVGKKPLLQDTIFEDADFIIDTIERPPRGERRATSIISYVFYPHRTDIITRTHPSMQITLQQTLTISSEAEKREADTTTLQGFYRIFAESVPWES